MKLGYESFGASQSIACFTGKYDYQVGADKDIKVDVRVVAAIKDLKVEIAEGVSGRFIPSFGSDFDKVPALNDRRDDIRC
jgi:DNA-binding NtrC family response regulator